MTVFDSIFNANQAGFCHNGFMGYLPFMQISPKSTVFSIHL